MFGVGVVIRTFGVALLLVGLDRLVRAMTGQARHRHLFKTARPAEERRFVQRVPGQSPVRDVGGSAMTVATVVVELGGRKAPGVYDRGGGGLLAMFRTWPVAGLTLDASFRPLDGAIRGE